MKFTLKDYQEEAVKEVLDRLRKARKRWHEDKDKHAFSLSATTGSGKTVMAAAAIEAVGTELDTYAQDTQKQADYNGAKTTATALFWVLAVLVGTVQGGIQALSRSYFGKLVPQKRSAEYFGFYDVFGKFATVIGPLLYAMFYFLTDRASIGILSLLLLFASGGLLLLFGRKELAKTEVEMREANARMLAGE